ncbi:MAG: DinB family protein [Gemmatimonadaceae bacterium]
MSLGISSELATYQTQFTDIRERAQALTGGLTSQQFNWRPGPERWSIAECFAHLNTTARRYQANMQVAIAHGRARGLTGSGAPAKYGWFSRWFEAQLEPPPKKRLKAPMAFQFIPAAAFDKAEVMGEFELMGRGWLGLLQACEGLDIARVKVISPAMSLLRFPIGAAFRHQLAHERRHLWQAGEVTKAPGFPAA